MTTKIEPHKDGFLVRLRFGKGLRQRFLIKLQDEGEARRRAAVLQELASDLTHAGATVEAPIILKKGAEATSDRDFRQIVKIAHELCEHAGQPRRVKLQGLTLRELGERWTDGILHRDYPDQIKLKKTAEDDAGRFENYVYPLIGDRPVASITLDDAEAVMRGLPKKLAPATRRQIGNNLARLLKLAVYPLRIIDRSPIPQGFLPSKGKRKAFAYLYPDEDARLLVAGKIAFCYRLLWGFLTREGMRLGEAIDLTWGDLDLARGAVRLDQNKTDDPRAWALQDGTAEALRRYRRNHCPNVEATDRVFVDHSGKPLSKFGLADLLREHLGAIGLKKERPELFTTTDERRQIRVHDLRGTFVTVALANGRPESWISDRTGHRSSAMISLYKRTARSFAELGLGDLVPLSAALPELRDGEGDSPEGGPNSGPPLHGWVGQTVANGVESEPTAAENAVAAAYRGRGGPSNPVGDANFGARAGG